MPSRLFQIVYLSRAVTLFNDDALRELGERAAARNRVGNVTGLLLHDGTRFIQALEGPQAQTRAIMTRIAADPRHTDIDFAADHPIGHRQFGDWSMDVRRTNAGYCSREFLAQVKHDVRAVTDPSLQAAFIGFAVLGGGGASAPASAGTRPTRQSAAPGSRGVTTTIAPSHA